MSHRPARGSKANNSNQGWNDTGSGWGSTDAGTDWGSNDAGTGQGSNDTSSGWGSNDTSSGWGSTDAGPGRSSKNASSGWGSTDAGAGRGSKEASSGWGSTDASAGRGSNDAGSGWGSNDAGSGWGSEEPQRESAREPTREKKRFKREDGGGNGRQFNREEGDDKNEEKEDRPAPYKPEDLNLEEEGKLYANEAGLNFDHYSDQKVVCLPRDVVAPVEKFEDVVASPLLRKNIASQNYSAMTPIQKWAMPAIMEGHDLIACAQTGSGKTAAFLLPVLQTLLNSDLEPNDPNADCKSPLCVIISPTRELANQIYVHANMLSRDSIIKCLVIYGQIATFHLKSKLSMGCHILVATPGRLKDFVQRGWIDFKNIKYVVLDEGDRLVNEGFLSDITAFFNHETMPPKESRQTLFFSATFRDETQLSAKQFLRQDKFVFLTVGRVGAANVDIKQEFLKVGRQEKKRELKKILESIPEEDKTIIFTQTKTAADMLAGFFSALNLSSTSIHGDRHQSQREQAIKSFRKGEKRFLISSPVGNRGLDLPKVSLVINYDLPNNIDEYVHRIGRTGRAGHTGRALSFFDEDRDREILPELIQILEEAKQEIPEWMKPGDSNFDSNFGENTETSKGEDGGETAPASDAWGAGNDEVW